MLLHGLRKDAGGNKRASTGLTALTTRAQQFLTNKVCHPLSSSSPPAQRRLYSNVVLLLLFVGGQ